MSKVRSIRFPDELDAQLDQIAALMQRPKAWVIVHALRDYAQRELPDILQLKAALDDARAHPEQLIPHEMIEAEIEQELAEVDSEIAAPRKRDKHRVA